MADEEGFVNLQYTIKAMENTVTRLISTIEEFLKNDADAIDWEAKPAPEKWSKKEILGHLVDSAQVNLERFVRCTYEENFKLVYDQNEWVAAKYYHETDIKEILDLWILTNRQIIRMLAGYPPTRLQPKCDTGKYQVKLHAVDWLSADYVDHIQHHLKQMIG
jgi:hypothetical protein